jgi:DNA-binding SARP family transcriptional activator
MPGCDGPDGRPGSRLCGRQWRLGLRGHARRACALGSFGALTAPATGWLSARAPSEDIDRRTRARVVVRLFGGFRLLKDERPYSVRPGGKTELLLSALALRLREGIAHDELVTALWPASDEALARQSLHTLTHELRRGLADALGGASPVIRADGRLRLNVESGIAVDVEQFEGNIATADRLERAGHEDEAMPRYEAAVYLYRGDLVIGSDIRGLLERERLRGQYLSLLARLAERHFGSGQYAAAQSRALELLTADPCREDAHRMVMRCAVRLGQRAQALRQYGVCIEILRREFGVEPEPATRDLFDRVRMAPAGV